MRITPVIDDPELPPIGVFPTANGLARWRVWAPKAKAVELVLGDGASARTIPLDAELRGYFSVEAPTAGSGQLYRYKLDGGQPKADPTSRHQPDGIDAPSAVVDPAQFSWNEGKWHGIAREELVIYELHVGTFTPEGTFDAVQPRLDALRELGITAIELMPVAQFPGERSWGYDGVFPFAVQNSYGGPEGLKRLVEACHQQGMAVLLDVVFNHFGPEGNILADFGPYLTEKHKSDWGAALNFDDEGCDAVRAFVLDNVRMWVGEYRVDGLRLDAADQIFDRGPVHIIREIGAVAIREAAKLGRPVHIFAETDLNDAPRFLLPAERGGYALHGHWTDDFHHAAHTTLTGESNGYYTDFAAGPPALAKAYRSVFVNDGIYSPFRDRLHGASAEGFTGDRFVAFTQNHDQVGNRAKSDRYAASLPAAAVRAAAGILLLAPRLPLLFMGEEYGETNPFPFFSDFGHADLIQAVRDGRKQEFASFGWQEEVPDPFSPTTRQAAVLSWDWSDPVRAGLRQLYRDLLWFRRDSPILRDFRAPEARLIGDPKTSRLLAMVRRSDAGTLTVLFNLGPEPRAIPADVADSPPSFRSEVAEYGATGSPEFTRLQGWEFAIFGPLP